MHDPVLVAANSPITITPLRTFPVIRDLVTDVSPGRVLRSWRRRDGRVPAG